MKNILITGHLGFIGSLLFERLKEMGYDVEGLDIKTGKDVRDVECVNDAIDGKDVVFHLAAVNNIEDTEGNPSLSYATSVDGTLNVVLGCRKNHAKLVFTSSSSVYGDTGPVPVAEESVLFPRGWYSFHKQLAEKNCNPFSDFIVRMTSVYGTSSLAHCVLNRFVRQIKSGESVLMFRNGGDIRDYVFVDDVVDALLLGMDNVGVYNVGFGRVTSISELLGLIFKYLDMEYSVKEMDKRLPAEQGVREVCLSMEKIWGLGWRAKVGLEEGLRRVCERD